MTEEKREREPIQLSVLPPEEFADMAEARGQGDVR